MTPIPRSINVPSSSCSSDMMDERQTTSTTNNQKSGKRVPSPSDSTTSWSTASTHSTPVSLHSKEGRCCTNTNNTPAPTNEKKVITDTDTNSEKSKQNHDDDGDDSINSNDGEVSANDGDDDEESLESSIESEVDFDEANLRLLSREAEQRGNRSKLSKVPVHQDQPSGAATKSVISKSSNIPDSSGITSLLRSNYLQMAAATRAGLPSREVALREISLKFKQGCSPLQDSAPPRMPCRRPTDRDTNPSFGNERPLQPLSPLSRRLKSESAVYVPEDEFKVPHDPPRRKSDTAFRSTAERPTAGAPLRRSLHREGHHSTQQEGRISFHREERESLLPFQREGQRDGRRSFTREGREALFPGSEHSLFIANSLHQLSEHRSHVSDLDNDDDNTAYASFGCDDDDLDEDEDGLYMGTTNHESVSHNSMSNHQAEADPRNHSRIAVLRTMSSRSGDGGSTDGFKSGQHRGSGISIGAPYAARRRPGFNASSHSRGGDSVLDLSTHSGLSVGLTIGASRRSAVTASCINSNSSHSQKSLSRRSGLGRSCLRGNNHLGGNDTISPAPRVRPRLRPAEL